MVASADPVPSTSVWFGTPLLSTSRSLKDFVALDTASSQQIQTELQQYMQSAMYPDAMGYRFANMPMHNNGDLPYCCRLEILRWLHCANANLPGLTVHIDVNSLLSWTSKTPVQCPRSILFRVSIALLPVDLTWLSLST
ncbi:hypothetical protein EON65_44755 [archaeon]|nr:MAG: hypothetical protein EON65_44755 [archaeon]